MDEDDEAMDDDDSDDEEEDEDDDAMDEMMLLYSSEGHRAAAAECGQDGWDEAMVVDEAYDEFADYRTTGCWSWTALTQQPVVDTWPHNDYTPTHTYGPITTAVHTSLGVLPWLTTVPPPVTNMQLNSFIDEVKRKKNDPWNAIVGNARAIHIADKLNTEAQCVAYVRAHRYTCCNHWRVHTPSKSHSPLKRAKHALYMRRMAGGCEGVGLSGHRCPFARRTDVWRNLHHADHPCTGETDDKIKSADVSVADFKVYLAQEWLVALCEMCHRLRHPHMVLT